MDELTREFLIESQEGLDRMERCLTDLETRPHDAALIAEIFRAVHTIKGTTGFLGFGRLESLSHSGENLLGLLREGTLLANAEIVSALLELLDGLRSILQSIEESGDEGRGDDAAMIAHLQTLQNLSAARPEPQEPKETQAVALHVSESAAPHPPSAAADSTLRVDVELLNRMMNLVGELVLTRNQVLQATAADVGFAPLSRRLDMVTADLREAVMKARMQPVGHVFSKFPRLVRDLAQTLGKRIRLEMEGQETELDKSLLEAIKDPLTHVVRNACDHGIEAAETRLTAGKNAEGLVRLRALQDGSHVVVEVIDDGGGLRVEKIRARALDRKLITPQQAAQMSEREVLQLIFLPGFSTAEAVTSVSGRGVGMDVVRNNVEKIGGKVEIDSKAGRGTVMRLRIPLTLAIVPALIVSSRGKYFALPQGALTELVHLSADRAAAQIEWLGGAPLYRLRGRLLPLVFLSRMLGLHPSPQQDSSVPAETAPEETGSFVAVMNADGRRYGLIVDGLADPEEIVVKPLSAILKTIGLFSGGTILGNGETALILDPGAIALRAGISLSGEEEEEETSEDLGTARSSAIEYLLVETGSRLAALPLTTVLRIERIPRSRLEHIGQTPVLRFEGALLPVDDSCESLAASHPEASGDEAQMTVVVCRDGHRHVGMAVSQVLDVADGRQLEEAGTGAIAAGVTLLKERVTSVVNLARIPALPPQAGPDIDHDTEAHTEAQSMEFSLGAA